MKQVKRVYNHEKSEWENIIKEPVVGQVVTVHLYSDSTVYDIIGVSKTTKKLTLRERAAILVEKAEFQVGGFGGHVTKNAVWKTESILTGHVITANWSEKDGCYKAYGSQNISLDCDSYFYDYNF